jgi:hypothetical protein
MALAALSACGLSGPPQSAVCGDSCRRRERQGNGGGRPGPRLISGLPAALADCLALAGIQSAAVVALAEPPLRRLAVAYLRACRLSRGAGPAPACASKARLLDRLGRPVDAPAARRSARNRASSER